MRRAWLLGLVLAIPLAGFECTVTVGLQPGDACDPVLDVDASRCSGNDVIYCASDGWVYEADCAAECGGAGTCAFDFGLGYNACVCDDVLLPGDACDYFWDAASSYCTGDQITYCAADNRVYAADCLTECSGAGSCTYSADFGYNACVCDDWQWAPGYACSYVNNYADGTCAADELTYCAEDDLIYAIDCVDYCVNDYGATAGSCGNMPETGYNGCVCEWATCTFSSYCYDALWMVYCDPTTTAAVWTNCDDECVGGGFTKGVCDAGTGQCSCI